MIYLNEKKFFDSNKVSLKKIKICSNQRNFCLKAMGHAGILPCRICEGIVYKNENFIKFY